jgi:hypothetical protein
MRIFQHFHPSIPEGLCLYFYGKVPEIISHRSKKLGFRRLFETLLTSISMVPAKEDLAG